jgi:hypothetical protein
MSVRQNLVRMPMNGEIDTIMGPWRGPNRAGGTLDLLDPLRRGVRRAFTCLLRRIGRYRRISVALTLHCSSIDGSEAVGLKRGSVSRRFPFFCPSTGLPARKRPERYLSSPAPVKKASPDIAL